MTGKKKNKTILIAVAALVLAGAGVYAYMNMEKLEVLIKKTTGSNSQDLLALAVEAEQSGDYDKALGYYQGFVDVHSDAPANTDVGTAYASMGNIYLKQFKYPKAIEYLKKGLDHSTQYGGKNSQLTADHWFALASIYDKQGEIKTALNHYKNSRNILVKLDGDTGRVDKVIDELEDYMVNANLQSRSS